ncbi:MAG: glyoxalase [Clostridia bacterium]|nr:glyoxalase [Clostridia bacterium]
MHEYDDEVLRTFLANQDRLFDEPVAETIEEAEAFLEDCMAVVVDSVEDVLAYFEDTGADLGGIDPADIEEISEVFLISDGRYLIVEG